MDNIQILINTLNSQEQRLFLDVFSCHDENNSQFENIIQAFLLASLVQVGCNHHYCKQSNSKKEQCERLIKLMENSKYFQHCLYAEAKKDNRNPLNNYQTFTVGSGKRQEALYASVMQMIEKCKTTNKMYIPTFTCLEESIKRIHFNPPLTVVLWNDGTKTFAKCSDSDTWDEEKGLSIAILKKFFGNKNVFSVFNSYIQQKQPQK